LAPGARRSLRRSSHRQPAGFSLIELLVVILIIGIGVSLVGLSLRDRGSAKLDEEGERLATLLEMARAESRVAGNVVRWVPAGANDLPGVQFRFVGLPATQPLPTAWLDPAVSAEVVGSTSVLLGPDAILPPQRIVLHLDDHALAVASDGLGPFAILGAAQAATP
jgi:general secretion pathway protein H